MRVNACRGVCVGISVMMMMRVNKKKCQVIDPIGSHACAPLRKKGRRGGQEEILWDGRSECDATHRLNCAVLRITNENCC
jgi:hypothetical protein